MTSSPQRTAASTARYKVVKEQIVLALSQGKWKRGQKIPSESQLAERHSVSIGTIRRAVGELVSENILTRAQGSGTFVVSHTPDYMLNAFFRIVDRDRHKELPTLDSLSIRNTRADAATAAGLRLRPRATVIEVTTLLSLQGRPTIFDRMRLPPTMFSDLTERVFASREGTVYGLFQQRFGITVVRMEEFVTAIAASSSESRLFGLAPGAPLLRVQRTAYTYKDVPVDYRVRLIDSTRHGYLSVMGAG